MAYTWLHVLLGENKPRRSEARRRTLMAGRAVFANSTAQVGLRRVAAQNHGLCNHRACPHCLDCMTHVAKLGGKKRGRVPRILYVGPACPRILLMARKNPTAVTKQGGHSSRPAPLKSQAFGTLNLTAGTPGAMGNPKSATCLQKCYNGRRSRRRRREFFHGGLCLRDEVRAEVGACVRVWFMFGG